MAVNGPRQRLAWTFLLTGLFTCLAISISAPPLVRYYLQNATRVLAVTVQANQGTVGIQEENGSVTGALFTGELPESIAPGGSVLTNAPDTALLIVAVPEMDDALARIQVYGNSSLNVLRATTPRFKTSTERSELALRLNNGRIRLTVPSQTETPLAIEIHLPQGIIEIDEEGLYSVSSSNVESQLAVLKGSATAVSEERALRLDSTQRMVLTAGGELSGPFDTERELVKNGDFSVQMSQWVELATNVEIADQPPVETSLIQEGGETWLGFKRVGLGHADAGIRQIVNVDITDFTSLRLLITMRVLNQSLGVCGQRGSECPLMVRIEYQDINGVVQTWHQGFFAGGEVAAETPDVCVACPPPLNVHQRIPAGQLVFYESENLLEHLGAIGILPRQINSINLIASGHSFDVEVIEVNLLASE